MEQEDIGVTRGTDGTEDIGVTRGTWSAAKGQEIRYLLK